MANAPQDTQFPMVTQAMLDQLDAIYPEQSADPKWTDREIWLRTGARQVVRFFHEQFRRQNNITQD